MYPEAAAEMLAMLMSGWRCCIEDSKSSLRKYDRVRPVQEPVDTWLVVQAVIIPLPYGRILNQIMGMFA